MRTLVDTDIWSEIFKGKNAVVLARAATYLSQHGCFTLTAVTVFEVVQGLQRVGRQDRIDAFRSMLEDIEVLDLDQDSADLAAVIHGELDRRGHAIDVGDAQNAAIALRHRLCVATGNVRHTPGSRGWAIGSSFRTGESLPRRGSSSRSNRTPRCTVSVHRRGSRRRSDSRSTRKAAWLALQSRSYETQGDWILERVLRGTARERRVVQ
jgi:tRNA(fMet)-specific endonuclease VapC